MNTIATIELDGAGKPLSFYDRMFEENCNLRTLVINEGIGENMLDDYGMCILKWNRDDKDLSESARKDPNHVINIIINSPGGDSMEALSFIDICLASKTPIRTIGTGMVASAAYWIYLAGSERYAFSNTSFLMHDGEMSIENSSSKAKQTVGFFESMDKRIKDYVISRTCMTTEFYDSVYEKEFWFFPDKGRELGVVHKIVGEDCGIEEIL